MAVTVPRGDIGIASTSFSVLVIDPLTFTFLMPDLTRIPLVQIEYRTVLAIEFGVGGAP